MNEPVASGWQILLEGFPWFKGEGNFPLPAYSEFMPPPRLGRRPYGEKDPFLFSDQDPYGWNISEIEEEYELSPGLGHLADRIVGQLRKLGQGQPGHRISGHKSQNLIDNPYWPPELEEAARKGKPGHERFVVLMPLALSRTQDDKGRVRWTFIGSSEQGPEKAFWKGFYSAPGQEIPEQEALVFFVGFLSHVFGESIEKPSKLHSLGFRILPSELNPRFPYWHESPLPSCIQPFIIDRSASFTDIKYLLTFQPFSLLPDQARDRYLEGRLSLLPFPGSLLFWGEQSVVRLQEQLPLAMQVPLLGVTVRHDTPGYIRIPQSGLLHEAGSEGKSREIHQDLLVNSYKRTSRWDRVPRHEDDVVLSAVEDKMAKVLFGTQSEDLRLYSKPMARNCQIWTENFELLLDGPNATSDRIARARDVIDRGGLFHYRFQFPAMRVGKHEIYWHRPLAAYWSEKEGSVKLLSNAPSGYMTAYRADSPDPANPVLLWPRLLQRETHLSALRSFEPPNEHYAHQTPLNILSLLEAHRLWGERQIPGSFARSLLRLPEKEALDSWLSSLSEKASDPSIGEKVREGLEKNLGTSTSSLPESITFSETATRSFEEALWRDIFDLSRGRAYVNTDNADCILDQFNLDLFSYCRRDLEAVGDFLLGRYTRAIAAAGMEGKALCGEIPFHWKTDFDFSIFGGWKMNQGVRPYERNILVMIPGKDRRESVILADHYDTAYMEDLYDKSRGGTGIRLAAAGADDNHSATSTLLQAAPVFLKLAREGRLERDVWLLHLTGEEFPSDCMGARHFCQALVEKTLRLRVNKEDLIDLSAVKIVGVFVMDMIGHNRDGERDVFQISPGKGAKSLRLAWQAHVANEIWNARAEDWNRSDERHGRGRGIRSSDGIRIPELALHPRLCGEVRTGYNSLSSLYNTDGQVFSDVGVPVVLFMENYDINRKGYHDTLDTMGNIDLDYCSAIAAIAIEAVAQTATEKSP